MSETSRTGNATGYAPVGETTSDVEAVVSLEQQQGRQEASTTLPSWVGPLCVSHGFAAWGERSWEFGVGLLLLYLNDNEDLRLTATLVLVSCTACVLWGSRIGSWVQNATMLRSAIVTLAVQNFGIVFAAIGFVMSDHSSSVATKFCIMVIILSSVVAKLGSLGSTIATEKRWTTILSTCGDPPSSTQSSFLSSCFLFQFCGKLMLFRYGRVDLHERQTSTKHTAGQNVDEEAIASDIQSNIQKGDPPRQTLENDTVVDDALSCETDGIAGEINKDDASRILARVNAKMRCIDLTCNLMAPMVVGFLLQYTSPTKTAVMIAVFNLVAWPMEVKCLLWIYRARETQITAKPVSLELNDISYQTESQHDRENDNTDLQHNVRDDNVLDMDNKPQHDTESVTTDLQQGVRHDDEPDINTEHQHEGYGTVAVVVDDADNDTELVQSHRRFYALRLYGRQPIFRSALALAVLYLTVISLGTLMTAWLVALGFHESYVGIARAFAAGSGMLATQVSPRATQTYGIDGAALRFILFMWSCILPCAIIAPLVVGTASHHGSTFSEQGLLVWIMVVAVILSRFGLWGFDLCVTQLLQERIDPPSALGSVNGTQAAIQSAFEALAALACVLLPDPKRFSFLVVGSFGSVTVATLLHICAYFRIQEKPMLVPS